MYNCKIMSRIYHLEILVIKENGRKHEENSQLLLAYNQNNFFKKLNNFKSIFVSNCY